MRSETRPNISFELYITLTEEEARALDAISGYGAEEFLRVFYNKLGKHYLEPHEDGLRLLFFDVVAKISPDLKKIDKTRKDWDK